MSDHDHDHEHDREHELDEEAAAEAELEARRQLALAQIRQYGDPVLRMQAHEIGEIDDDVRRLVDRMTSLMEDAQGVGLAATQVGVLRRLFVFVNGEDGPQAVVNPIVVERVDETETDEEGCLRSSARCASSSRGSMRTVSRCGTSSRTTPRESCSTSSTISRAC